MPIKWWRGTSVPTPHTAGRDWAQWLPQAQFVLSTSVCRTTGVTPFYIVYGRQAHTPASLMGSATAVDPPNTTHFVNHLAGIWAECSAHMKATQLAAEKYLNAGHTDTTFQVGSYVLLDRAYRSPFSKVPKLEAKHDGPFRVLERVRDQAYTLDLPPAWRMHPTVWAGRLTAYHGEPPNGPLPLETIGPVDDEEYAVSRITNHRRRSARAGMEYLVHWEGYRGVSTWEPVRNLSNCADILREYRIRVGLEQERAHPVAQPSAPSPNTVARPTTIPQHVHRVAPASFRASGSRNTGALRV
jgi:hypothetical protein